MAHPKLDRAKAAIEALSSDRSISADHLLEMYYELIEELQTRKEALEIDLANDIEDYDEDNEEVV